MIRRVVTLAVLVMVVAIAAVAVLSSMGTHLAPQNASVFDRAGFAAEKLLEE